ncbi:TonB-dependent receptor P26 [Bacteroides pyogenes]|uniref:SusC/RagA family TonB-linked outer membrane protein n=1 Tax=Bacteroides pyogenes TaxID=310300 RepID=UPI0011E3D7BD|nr:TonB-dependent receptor [Bacteroides pyogenes]MBR8721054.1 TonB-dependent receptor P26 [Bacteroides pyogenes]MBR8787923.1 TonB-dependent receptor P26 [Bacteroides pyogenes]MBR8793396.1 TonB-dependent receptor P26 [Bacteroides pyogenes]MDY4248858.1 TonB-dependent receptor [Bacteroides pyogenes]TYK37030.1 TonB-dependent receptor [Bacteroides pyogenes]
MKKRIRWNARFITSLIIAFMCSINVSAQNVIKGTVTDGNDEPLPGVSVAVKGTTIGTVTDINGKYSINAKDKDILIFSYIGMATQEVRVNGRSSVSVKMKDDVASLDEIVVVGYGTQKRGSITGAVSTVSDKELLKAPTMSISNIVGSRIAGVAAVQSSGQPGSDNAALTMRGQDGIIYVIDGIRRTSADFNGLDPNVIESVSILKDASAVAVYGLDASGAFIVTTKKGQVDKMSITYTGTVGISQNAAQQQWLDGPGYAYWYNKARELQGDPIVFTNKMVQKMREGKDGWGNTNWYDKIYGTGTRTHHNISATGGSERIKFFASIGYLKENGNIDNYNYERLNLRSNIDAKLTKSLTFQLGVSGRVEKRNAPRYSANPNDWHNVPQQIIRALPYVPDTYEYQGKRYNVSTPTASSPVAPLASINESGYSRSNYSYFQSNFVLQYDAPWLKGLSFKFQGAYDLTFTFSKILSNPYDVMIMNLPTADSSELTYHKGYDAVGNTISLSEAASRGYAFTTQTSIVYNNKFDKHSVGGLLLAETRENKSNALSATGYGLDFIQLDELNKITNRTGDGSEKYPGIGGYSGHRRVAGFVGRLNYNYDDKYYLEASLRYDGSYLFGGMNKRWITLPGISVGWRINKEDWFNVSSVNNLKFRIGAGKTATSNLKPFQWRNLMNLSKNAIILGGSSQSMLYASVLGNPYLKWSECLNYNLGVDATLWNGLLGAEIDVFYKYEFDKLSGVTGSFSPSRGGYYYQYANSNKCDYKGYEITLTHHNNIRDFNYGAKLIWSYAYGRWLKYAGDSDNSPEYQRATGKQIGAKYGFIADGLFQSDEEIANSATVRGYKALPGYIKYVDRNGDGIITAAQDQGYVGKSSTPTHTGSLNLFGNWRGFDFDLLFSWGLNSVVALTGQYTATGSEGVQDNTSFTKPFYHGGNSPTFLVENSWTPENRNAEFPRLEIAGPSNNNGFSSTFWYRKGDYLRLKTAQLGYNFPKKWLYSTGIQALRLYVEGYNLFTLSSLIKYNIDPESPAVNNGYYPQQRTYTMGVKLTF